MSSLFDTIVAPITASGPAAVAVIRLSGPESWDISALLFEPWPLPVRPRFALYGRFATGDDGLALPFEEGASYTGERSAELSIHGSPASVRALTEMCQRAGARAARPGEFTERAFLNGRIDLTQAEGVRDTVDAATEAQLRQANLMREGALREAIQLVREEILKVMAAIEASVDFSEEVGDLDRASAQANLGSAVQRLTQLEATASAGRILRQGLRIAIVGPPNAGKSSLLNALSGFDRALVTEVPGTTRDFIEETVELGGVPCVLTDTAGLRESGDRLENLGIGQTHRIWESADRIWYVYDGLCGWTDEDERYIGQSTVPVRVLADKSDLNWRGPNREGALPISALSGEGISKLIELVAEELRAETGEAVWINERHAPLIASATLQLESAIATLGADLPFDLAVVHLQAALEALGQITGESASADILEQVFRNFCVGK